MNRIIFSLILFTPVVTFGAEIGTVSVKTACANIGRNAEITEANINERVYAVAGKDQLIDISLPTQIQKDQVCVTVKLKTVAKPEFKTLFKRHSTENT